VVHRKYFGWTYRPVDHCNSILQSPPTFRSLVSSEFQQAGKVLLRLLTEFARDLKSAFNGIQWELESVLSRMQAAKNQGQYYFDTYHHHCTRRFSDSSKCDLTVPACSQCLKAGKVCEGYRTESDFLFRDHSQTATHKVRDQRIGSRVRSSAPNLAETTSCAVVAELIVKHQSGQQLPRPRVPSLQCALAPGSVEDEALCFFFSTYATPQSAVYQASFCAQLPDMYKHAAGGQTLKHIIPAIGLGGLARRRGDAVLLVAADAAYHNAVRQTNHALCHLETATSDQTLIGVLLLGLYEASLPSPAHDRQAS
jgi:hypothetical protein